VPAVDFATHLIDALVGMGVREVVLCPGSRSAPLAYAAYAAEQAGRLRLHVRVDERSAAFLALGLAKTSRVPAAVITTSGTAVANLHPAVLEAHHGKVPLIVLSADRPAALRGSGANQTTIQPGIFPGAVRLEADLDETAAPWDVAGEAWRAATGAAGDPGPVHLNICLSEPLVPAQWPMPPAEPSADAPPQDGENTCPTTDLTLGGDRTLVILGDLVDPRIRPAVVDWAARHSLPVIAEPFGEHGPEPGVIPHGPLLLTDQRFLDSFAPQRVLVAGRLTLSRPVTALLRRPGLRVEALADTSAHADPVGVVNAGHELYAVLAAGLRAGTSAGQSAWADAWRDSGVAIAEAVAADPPPWPSGLAVAATLVATLPERAILFTGPSNPVRDIDFGVAQAPAGSTIVASRGLAGIDGCVSTAVGIALCAPGRPAYALLGDLTFLHDSNGLLIGPDEPRPDLTIVVVNDAGGGIFGLLEPGRPPLRKPFERIFGTATGTDLGTLARAHGIPHALVAGPEELTAAIAEPPHGIRIVEVRVERDSHAAAHAHLREVAAAALRDVRPA